MSAPVDVRTVLSRRSAELTRKYGADNDLSAVLSATSRLIDAAREATESGCPCGTCEALRAAVRDCGGAA